MYLYIYMFYLPSLPPSPSVNHPDSAKKRSKLVLPAPQISDSELEEVCALIVLVVPTCMLDFFLLS